MATAAAIANGYAEAFGSIDVRAKEIVEKAVRLAPGKKAETTL